MKVHIYLSIDEKLLIWKGRLIFKQYIPNKRAQFGIKMLSLCEELWNSFIYVGKNGEPNPEEEKLERRIGKSGAVVICLIKELLGCGYNFYVDNWYASQSLFEYLYEYDTVAASTAQKNRIDLPISFKEIKLEKIEHDFRRNKNLLVVKFPDKKEILLTRNLLSTIHIHFPLTSNEKKRSQWRKCSKIKSNS